MIVDTDVLIDCLRGRSEAAAFIKQLIAEDELAISVISVAELEAGVRDGERETLDAFLSLMQRHPVSEAIARTAGAYARQYAKSHGLLLPDAIIAATAHHHSGSLATLNRKHYPMIDISLQIPYPKA